MLDNEEAGAHITPGCDPDCTGVRPSGYPCRCDCHRQCNGKKCLTCDAQIPAAGPDICEMCDMHRQDAQFDGFRSQASRLLEVL